MRPQKTQNWLRQLSLRPPKKSPRFGQVSWRFSSARDGRGSEKTHKSHLNYTIQYISGNSRKKGARMRMESG